MTYIKRLVMQGFKSFAKKTELPLTPEINVVIGPNGSGKSNVADALCFVLGRISAKSMRAAKASNLIFAGTKIAGPAKEASVEIAFSNESRVFSVEEDEVIVKRILRKNGQSIYRLNGKTSTRQDILSILAQAGIDPNGFNIILQNEIQGFATGSPEERRKLIEEVAGISIYESRKEKSLRELDKTNEKLKEVDAILRERTSFLNNLEKEREAALKKKTLEEDLKKYKAGVIYYDLTQKKKEGDSINKQIESRNEEIEKHKKSIVTIQTNIENLELKITSLNAEIQRQTGLEQEQLNREISDLRADIAVLKVKIEAHEKKVSEIERQKNNFQKILKENDEEIQKLRKDSPTIALIQKELEKKKAELEKLEEERKKYYMTKTELRTLRDRVEDKKRLIQNYENEISFLTKQISSLTDDLFDKKTTVALLDELRHDLAENKSILDRFNIRERELDKIINVNSFDIKREKEVTEKIEKLDICPLCKSKITEDHIKNINNEIEPRVSKLQKEIDDAEKELKDIKEKRGFLSDDIDSMINEIQKRQSDLIKMKNIQEKEEQLKKTNEKLNSTKDELKELEKKKINLESNFDENSTIEEKYETVKIEVQDISIRNKENLDSEIQYKQKELERASISIKQLIRDESELKEEIIIVQKNLSEKEQALLIKKGKEEELRQKADKYIKERNEIHQKQREMDRELSIEKNKVQNLINIINNMKIDKARVDAQIQNLETDILDYPNVEIVKGNRDVMLQKLRKVEEILSRIGNVNMRALETYEEVKKEYDSIREKSDTINKEKEKIMKIIAKIDIEKKKVFIRTVENLNEKFMRNFSQISTKGQVYLEIQNKKDPFQDGIDVILKTGHGKYFDIKSLSGGEKTMVALSLIFAIQELKPYCFYILDEIDAALDKRNASRLADFLKKYAQKGQYIVISHNDEIISNAQTLFGVSMHDGISKLTGLKV